MVKGVLSAAPRRRAICTSRPEVGVSSGTADTAYFWKGSKDRRLQVDSVAKLLPPSLKLRRTGASTRASWGDA